MNVSRAPILFPFSSSTHFPFTRRRSRKQSRLMDRNMIVTYLTCKSIKSSMGFVSLFLVRAITPTGDGYTMRTGKAFWPRGSEAGTRRLGQAPAICLHEHEQTCGGDRNSAKAMSLARCLIPLPATVSYSAHTSDAHVPGAATKRTSRRGRKKMAGATFLSAPALLGLPSSSSASSTARRHAHIQVCCHGKAESSEAAVYGEPLQFRRRDLIGGCFSTAVGLEIIEGSTRFTGVAAAADLIERRQRSEFQSSIKGTLTAAIQAKPELVPSLLTLALNDAMTYDKATKSGGPNGSIRLSAEISRPENSGLSAALDMLTETKKEIDSYSKGGPIAFADLIQIAAQQALKQTFLDAAIAKTGGNEEKGRTLYSAYGSSGQWGLFDKIFGREDTQEPDPEGRVPKWSSASLQEMKDKFIAVGFGPRQLAVMSAFLGPDQAATEAKLIADPDCRPWVEKYQRSRETVSRTDYEVDLITTLTKLSYLGQKINYEAYTYPKQKINLGNLKL